MATYIPQTFKTAAMKKLLQNTRAQEFSFSCYLNEVKKEEKKGWDRNSQVEFMNCLEKLSTLMAQAEHFALFFCCISSLHTEPKSVFLAKIG